MYRYEIFASLIRKMPPFPFHLLTMLVWRKPFFKTNNRQPRSHWRDRAINWLQMDTSRNPVAENDDEEDGPPPHPFDGRGRGELLSILLRCSSLQHDMCCFSRSTSIVSAPAQGLSVSRQYCPNDDTYARKLTWNCCKCRLHRLAVPWVTATRRHGRRRGAAS